MAKCKCQAEYEEIATQIENVASAISSSNINATRNILLQGILNDKKLYNGASGYARQTGTTVGAALKRLVDRLYADYTA